MSKNKRTKRMPLRGLSIQQRLPLLICILLLGMIVAFGLVSYIEVKQAAIKSGTSRLRSLNDQLATMFSQSLRGTLSSTRTVANQESLRNCLRSVNSTCTDAKEALHKIMQDSTSIMVDLLDSEGDLVLRSGKDSIQNTVDFKSLYASLKLDSGTVGKILRVRDSMYYPLIAGVTDKEKLIGYLVRWRIINTTAKAVEQFSQLLGTESTIYIGNSDQTLWTDMIKPIPTPVPAGIGNITDVVHYTSTHGNKVIAAEKTIAGTPWLLLMEVPEGSVMKAANRFLQRIIFIGFILVVIGILLVWFMSQRITSPLNRLTAAVTGIASGNYATTNVAIDRRDEVGKLSRAFNATVAQVQRARQALEHKIIETEQMNEQLRDLSAHLQNIREEERMHIAREMHDELGQLLTGFKMDVSWLNKRLADNKDPGVKDRLLEMTKIIDESVAFVRRLAAELRPSILDDLGIVAALEWQSKEFTKRYGIEIDLRPTTKELQISDLAATGLFRIYQESLTNVARHSGANKVSATLDIVDGYIYLSISDNGKGFDTSVSGERKTLGLLGMKERALMIGGNLSIQSEPGKGTTVLITVPLTNDTQKSTVNGYDKEEKKELK